MPELDDFLRNRGGFRDPRQPQPAPAPAPGATSLSGINASEDVVDPRTGQALASNFGGVPVDTTGNLPPPPAPAPAGAPGTGQDPRATSDRGGESIREPTENLPSTSEMSVSDLETGIARAEEEIPGVERVPVFDRIIGGLREFAALQMTRELMNRQSDAAGGPLPMQPSPTFEQALDIVDPGGVTTNQPGRAGEGGGGGRGSGQPSQRDRDLDRQSREATGERTSQPGGQGGV